MSATRSQFFHSIALAPLLVSSAVHAADDPKSDEDNPAAETPAEEEGSEPTKEEPEAASASVGLSSSESKANEDESDTTAPTSRGASGTGFYLRATLGGGHSWAHAKPTEDQPDLAMQMLGGGLMLSPGYEFAPGLAVHADLYSAMLFSHKSNPGEDSEDYSPQGIGLVTSTLGIGMSYHALPSDLYVSGGFGISEAWGSRWLFAGEVGRTAILTRTAFTNPGYAAHGSIGKLFPVHDRWSMGASLNYNLQTFGRPKADELSFSRVHSLWLGFSTAFHPKRP